MGETISKHIFILPIKFKCMDSGDTDVMDTFQSALMKSEYEWIKKTYKKKEKGYFELEQSSKLKIEKSKTAKDTVADYNKMQYFYPEVRKIIFDQKEGEKYDSDDLVNNYELNFASGVYIIKTSKREYELELEKILLKVYPTGVATLSYFVNNDKYLKSEEILEINQKGRRIRLPYIGKNNVNKLNYGIDMNASIGAGTVADELRIIFKSSTLEDISGKFEFKFKSDDEKNFNDILYTLPINSIVTNLLGKGFALMDSEEAMKSDMIYDLVIDERMYVMSFCFQGVLRNFKNLPLWYEYVFVDEKGSYLNLDSEFLKETIKKHTYSRWKGHVYGISNYSFVCSGSDDYFNKNIVSDHIKGLYFEMVSIHLMQKASLQKFSEQLTNQKSVVEFLEIQKDYLFFIDNYCFQDIGAQEQCIELFDMIKNITQIELKIEKINEKISKTAEFYRVEEDRKTSKKMNLLTIVIFIIGIFSFYESIRTSYFKFNLEGGVLGGIIFKNNKSEIFDYLKCLRNFDGIVILVLIIVLILLLHEPCKKVRVIWSKSSK